MTEELEKLLAAATPGPWHHVQAFERVPAVRTIHGRVPGQRVDYVSTWPGPGTPKGHRVVIPMETVAEGHVVQTARSADMALIVAAVNALPELLALREENERLREALTTIGHSLVCAPTDYAEHNASELLKAGNIARAALNQETGQ